MTTTPVSAVMAAFRPGATFEENLARVARQVAWVEVVDDTGDGDAVAQRVARLGMDNVHVITNQANQGLAVSLNTAIRRAVAQGAGRVITFDQDTSVPDGYVDALMTFMDRQGDQVLVVGPETVGGERQPVSQVRAEGACSLRILQSGMLVRARAFEIVGGFRDEFFIDVLEPDFLARCHRAGFHALLAPGVDLPHTIGSTERVKLLWFAPKTTNHEAFRRYLMTRNGLVVARENVTAMPGFALDIVRGVVTEAWRAVVLEHDRLRKARAIVAGLLDGLRMRLGPPPSRFL